MTVTTQDIRRNNLLMLLRDHGSKVALAARLGVSAAYISHLITDKMQHRKLIHEDTARAIEVALRLPDGELDRPGAGDVLAVNQPYFAPRSVPPAAQPAIDAALLKRTIGAVLAVVDTDDQQRLADIVTLAYRHNSAFGDLDDGYVRALADVIK